MDPFWGVGAKYLGHNEFGLLLMYLRDNVLINKPLYPPSPPQYKGEAIEFYDSNKAYACFTNFSKHPVTLQGVSWPTSEHLFQSFKVRHSSFPFQIVR
jgi:predicted NAD-dependent protein-ADP-ribosyltransferase YbiA (DUF1768 family)